MAKNGSKENIVELWGHEFSLTKNGLDEAQVVSFVNDVISERDLLLQRAEHLSTLTKLAEKTIVEADRLAAEIKQEAEDKAKAEAEAILAKADEEAQQLIEEKRTEIITMATEEGKAIRANAEREATLFIEQQRGRIQPEIKKVAQQLYRELLSHIEDLKQQAKASAVEFEHKLSQLPGPDSMAKIEEEPALTRTPVDAVPESGTFDESLEFEPERKKDVAAEPQPSSQVTGQVDIIELEAETSPSGDGQHELGFDKEVELEILPPLDIKQIMGIMRYLDGLAEVESTELIPLTDKPVIVVSLHESVPMMELLQALPEVDEASEVTEGEDTPAEGKRRKIQIRLAGNSVPDDTKERLNSKV